MMRAHQEGRLRMPVTIRNATCLPALCAAAWIAACSTPGSHSGAPATPTAQACALQCQNTSSQCRAREDSGVQQCQWRSQQTQRDLDNCKANTGAATQCPQQVPLCPTADYGPCDGQYHQCEQACGGAVTEAPKR